MVFVDYKARLIPSNYAIKRAALENNVETAQIFITGSSHAYYGIKPDLLGNPAVSIAYVGQDIYYDTHILSKYLSDAKSAKLIIITVSYPSFEYRMQDSIWKNHISFYRKFWNIQPQHNTFELADYSTIALFGVQRSRDFLLTGKVSELDSVDKYGGNDNLRLTDSYSVRNGRTAVKRQEAEINKKYITQNVEYLDGLLNALKQSNVRAVFITTPCFHTYYENLNAERYLRMQNEIQLLSKKYNVEYGNYLKDDRFTAEDFFDADHLNTTGARKFSVILREEVIRKYFSEL